MAICAHVGNGGKFEEHLIHIPSWGRIMRCFALLFSSHAITSVSVLSVFYLVSCFLQLCTFCWWFCCWKWPPSMVLKCCLAFLRARKLYKYMLEKLPSGILNKVSLHRNTNKTRLWADWLMENIVIRGWQEPKPWISARSNGSVFANSGFLAIL